MKQTAFLSFAVFLSVPLFAAPPKLSDQYKNPELGFEMPIAHNWIHIPGTPSTMIDGFNEPGETYMIKVLRDPRVRDIRKYGELIQSTQAGATLQTGTLAGKPSIVIDRTVRNFRMVDHLVSDGSGAVILSFIAKGSEWKSWEPVFKQIQKEFKVTAPTAATPTAQSPVSGGWIPYENKQAAFQTKIRSEWTRMTSGPNKNGTDLFQVKRDPLITLSFGRIKSTKTAGQLLAENPDRDMSGISKRARAIRVAGKDAVRLEIKGPQMEGVTIMIPAPPYLYNILWNPTQGAKVDQAALEVVLENFKLK